MSIYDAIAIGFGVADFIGIVLGGVITSWLFRQHYREHDSKNRKQGHA